MYVYSSCLHERRTIREMLWYVICRREFVMVRELECFGLTKTSRWYAESFKKKDHRKVPRKLNSEMTRGAVSLGGGDNQRKNEARVGN